MKLVVQGESYDFDEEKMSVSDARIIKANAGMGITQWAQGLQDGDPDALVALVFLAKKRAGEAPRWADFDNLELSDIDIEDDEPEPVVATNGTTPGAGSGKPAKAAAKAAGKKGAGTTPSSE